MTTHLPPGANTAGKKACTLVTVSRETEAVNTPRDLKSIPLEL